MSSDDYKVYGISAVQPKDMAEGEGIEETGKDSNAHTNTAA